MTKYAYEYTLEELERLLEQGPVVLQQAKIQNYFPATNAFPVVLEHTTYEYHITCIMHGTQFSVSHETLIGALMLRCFGPYATIERPTVEAGDTPLTLPSA